MKILNSTLTLALLLAVPVLSQENEARSLRYQINQLNRQNAKLDRELAYVDSIVEVEKGRDAIRISNYEKDIERRKKELNELRSQINTLTGKINVRKNKVAGVLNRLDNDKMLQQALLGGLEKVASGLLELISKSLPWDVELREQRVKLLIRDIGSGNTNVMDAMSRLNVLFQEEIRWGDETALYTNSVTRNNGEVVNVQLLRLGNQALVYVDEEKKKYGVMIRKVAAEGYSYTWKEEFSFGEREQIREMLDVKAGKIPPRLTTLPLDLDGEELKTVPSAFNMEVEK